MEKILGHHDLQAPRFHGFPNDGADPEQGLFQKLKRDEALNQKAGRAGEYLDDSAITAKIKAEILCAPLLNPAT